LILKKVPAWRGKHWAMGATDYTATGWTSSTDSTRQESLQQTFETEQDCASA